MHPMKQRISPLPLPPQSRSISWFFFRRFPYTYIDIFFVLSISWWLRAASTSQRDGGRAGFGGGFCASLRRISPMVPISRSDNRVHKKERKKNLPQNTVWKKNIQNQHTHTLETQKKTKTSNNTFFLGGGGDETLRKAHTQKHTHTRNPFSVGFCCLFVCFLMLRDEKGLEIRKRRQHSESFPISSNSIRACVCPLSVCASLWLTCVYRIRIFYAKKLINNW